MTSDPFLQEKFHSIEEKLKRLNPEEIRENLYTALSFLCQVWSAYQDGKEQKGWSENLYTEANTPVFSPEDQARIEEAFQSILRKQQGGAGEGGSAGQGDDAADEDSAGLDTAFEGLLQKLDSIDQFWNSIAYESPGVYKLISNTATPLPPPLPPVPIPNATLMTFFTGLLELLRLFISIAPTDFRIMRYCTTVLIMLDDAISGNWRQLLLSSLGFYSQMGMFIGVTGRLFVSTWLFMNPQIRTNIAFDMFRGFKSVLVGFLLWAFTVLAPVPVKFIVEQALERVKQVAGMIEQQIETLKATANPALNPLGYELRVKLDVETLKDISFADIQNIQTLATWGQFICAAEVQVILKELKRDPVFRVIVELFGIPTTKTDLQKVCGPSLNLPLVEVLKSQVEAVPLGAPMPGPAVLVGKVQGGGTRRTKLADFRHVTRRVARLRRRQAQRSRRARLDEF